MLLETARLILAPWEPTDWLAFRPIATDPEVLRYINGGVPWTDDQIREFAQRQIALYAERGFCRWKLIEKESGAMIGFCGAAFWRHFPDPEIGWWLARPRWGHGLATEAARAALRDLLERVQLSRLISVAMPANTASIAIMKKLGLTFECAFENEGVQLVRYAIGRSGLDILHEVM